MTSHGHRYPIAVVLAFVIVCAAATSHAGDCKRVSSQCIDTTPSKVISGVTVTLSQVGGCWMYEDTYVCLKPNAVNYCQPLINAGCWQTSARCIENDTYFGTGCMKATYTYRCDDPSLPTPPNTIRLDNSYTLVSSNYDKEPCASIENNPSCSLAESICVQTSPDQPLPPGISPSAVAPDGCYRREDRYACLTGKNDMGCEEYAQDPNCTLTSSECDDNEYVDGKCLSTTKTYRCIYKKGATKTITDCGTQQFCFNGVCFDTGSPPDTDFAKVVAYMEAMREAGTYMDQSDLTLFKGVDSRCTRKALVNCCKAKAGGAPSNYTLYESLIKGAGFAYDYAASKYMYDTLYSTHDFIFNSSIPNWLYNMTYNSQPIPTTPSFSVYGFTVQYGTSAPTSWIGSQIGVDAIQLGSQGNFFFTFDPATFVITFAVGYLLEDLMSCDQSDVITGMRVGNNLCHYVGVYTSKKFPRERTQTYCCYNSRLAKIINVEGRKQLGKGWGDAKSPNCSGFTPAELQSLDFSRMDLSEFYAEIVPKNLDIEAIKSSIQNRIVTNPTRSYFDQSRP